MFDFIKNRLFPSLLVLMMLSGASCINLGSDSKPRLSMFIGVDISGSFLRGKYFEDSITFISHYIYAHLNGMGGLDVPNVLFVGSLGGSAADEPKTFYPIQTFEGKSIEEINAKLKEIFPKNKENAFTDFNAFFKQIEVFVKTKNLVLRPISIIMISDGKPDVPNKNIEQALRTIDLKPLELLSRNVTVRLLYTDAVTGMAWQTKVSRQRVKVWTQDAKVMELWKDPKILVPGKAFNEQEKLFSWIKDNVDFGVRFKKVD
ncbi:MAG: hypothetical protein JXA66_00850 [Oligoflexia bacterium]|nr:hypothetical protein [Oligoflexia bacterium]